MAYHTRMGDAFRQYDPLDFDLASGNIAVAHRGGQILRCEGNVLLFVAERVDFEVTVRGFDERRDLRIRTVGVQVLDDHKS